MKDVVMLNIDRRGDWERELVAVDVTQSLYLVLLSSTCVDTLVLLCREELPPVGSQLAADQ